MNWWANILKLPFSMLGSYKPVPKKTKMKIEEFKVLVLRQQSDPDWTLSNFYFNEVEKGVGCEDEKRKVKVYGETCIDDGIYDMGLRHSPKFSRHFYRDDNGNLLAAIDRKTPEQKAIYHTMHEAIWVMDVPKFDLVLWHWGNTDDDTNACYVVGSIFGMLGLQRGVLGSKLKYKEIYPILWRAIKAGKVTVEYRTEDKNKLV